MSSLLEFYRPEHLRPVDSEGYELPEWENPYFRIPDEDPINDALFAAEIGDWFDTAPEPSEDDVTWLNTHPILPPIAGGAPDVEAFEPSPADWDDFARWSGALTDQDIMAAGGAVG